MSDELKAVLVGIGASAFIFILIVTVYYFAGAFE